jgi:hypothetical protein
MFCEHQYTYTRPQLHIASYDVDVLEHDASIADSSNKPPHE